MALTDSLIAEVTSLAYAEGDSKDVENHAKLLRTIHKLQLAAEKPVETAKRIMYQPPINIALRMAVEFGLLDTLSALDQESSITAHSLAEATGAEELLITVGICDEIGSCKYSANSVTRELALEGLNDGVKSLYDTVVPAATGLLQCLDNIGRRAPTTAYEAPFAFAEKVPMFQWMKEIPDQRQYFDNYMAARRREVPRWFDIWPVSNVLSSGLRPGPKRVLLVDVGASHGHDLVIFKELHGSFPGRLVLQDLPETIDTIPNLPKGIEAMAYDFFAPQPVTGKCQSTNRPVCDTDTQTQEPASITSALFAMTGTTNPA
ncbi:MAG: hypothetical protein Q9170_005340 [Blastenia crenularia]